MLCAKCRSRGEGQILAVSKVAPDSNRSLEACSERQRTVSRRTVSAAGRGSLQTALCCVGGSRGSTNCHCTSPYIYIYIYIYICILIPV
jgi:hypothetical protein